MLNKLQKWLDNFVTSENQYYIFNPVEEHAPELMHDIVELKEKLLQHQANGDRIAIVADYDADGMTSSAILSILMRVLEIKFKVYIPDRVIDGYGMSKRLVDLAKEDGFNVILTCDNGIAAHESVSYAKSLGFPVYVTDHHEQKETLPEADLIVHPALGTYPWHGLSGGGVAYKVAQMFYDNPNFTDKRKDMVKAYAAISLIADVMDLAPNEFNENRKIVFDGVEIMRHNDVGPLDVLIKELNQPKETLTETSIGFFIGPSLNASGRIGSPYLSYELLIEENNQRRAEIIAREMNQVNTIRKSETKKMQDIISEGMILNEPIQVVYGEGIHEGVIGLIAGNITSKLDVPSIVFTETHPDAATGEALYKASCRSSTFSIYDLLTQIDQSFFKGWGGHPQAAGVTIYAKHYEEFKAQAREIALKMSSEYVKPDDYILEADIFELKEYSEDLEQLRPMGQGFRQPKAKCRIEVGTISCFNKSGHVKLNLTNGKELWLFKSLNDDEMKRIKADSKVVSTNFKRLVDGGMSKYEAGKVKNENLAHRLSKPGLSVNYEIDITYTFENSLDFMSQQYGTVASIISYNYGKLVEKEVKTTKTETKDVMSELDSIFGL